MSARQVASLIDGLERIEAGQRAIRAELQKQADALVRQLRDWQHEVVAGNEKFVREFWANRALPFGLSGIEGPAADPSTPLGMNGSSVEGQS